LLNTIGKECFFRQNNILENMFSDMKRIYRIIILLIASTLVVMFSSGCVVALVAVGAGALSSKNSEIPYTFSDGEMKRVESTTMDKALISLEKTAKDMKFTIESQSRDASNSVIEAKDSKGTKINIGLEKVTDNTVEIKIKVGSVGDEKYSYKILKTLRKNILSVK